VKLDTVYTVILKIKWTKQQNKFKTQFEHTDSDQQISHDT